MITRAWTFPSPRHAARLATLTLLLALPAAAGTHPSSCKPQVPVDVQLRLLDSSPGAPVRFEAEVTALRPVEDLDLQVRLPAGATWAGGTRQLAGKLDAGARRALPMAVSLPPSGISEISVRVNFRLAGGMHLSRGAYLKFEDGHPWQPPTGRESSWDGVPVLEFPARGVSR